MACGSSVVKTAPAFSALHSVTGRGNKGNGFWQHRSWLLGQKWRGMVLSSGRSSRARMPAAPVNVTVGFSNTSAEALQSEFGCEGVRFLEVAGLTIIELKVENGSSARMVLPGAQITSYKPVRWHGGREELLHTVLDRGDGEEEEAEIRGGVGLFFSEEDGPAGSIFCLSGDQRSWKVDEVTPRPGDYVQVILSCCHSWQASELKDASLAFRYVVTLSQSSLTSALVVSNVGRVPVSFTGAIVNHFGLNSLRGVFGMGLQGSRYQSFPFPPQDDELPSWPRLWGITSEERAVSDSDSWEEEKSQDTVLSIGMNRLFSQVSKLALIDRGKRRTVIVHAMGFEDFQLSNPGVEDSRGEFMQFDKNEFDQFICCGPAQAYQPLVLNAGEQWRAAQKIEFS